MSQVQSCEFLDLQKLIDNEEFSFGFDGLLFFDYFNFGHLLGSDSLSANLFAFVLESGESVLHAQFLVVFLQDVHKSHSISIPR